MMTERESRLARLNIDRGSTGSYREKPLLASYFQHTHSSIVIDIKRLTSTSNKFNKYK